MPGCQKHSPNFGRLSQKMQKKVFGVPCNHIEIIKKTFSMKLKHIKFNNTGTVL